MAHGKVDAITEQIHQSIGGADQHFDARAQRVKIRQARQQPLHGKAAGAADGDGVGAVVAHQTLGRVRDLPQRRADGTQVNLALGRQFQALGVADEQGDADCFFQLGDLLADRCRRDKKLARRTFHTGVTPRCFKAQQGVQGREFHANP